MPTSTEMPYRYGAEPPDEDPYRRQIREQTRTVPNTGPVSRPLGDAPRTYSPAVPGAPPSPTFAERQSLGQARPPAPSYAPAVPPSVDAPRTYRSLAPDEAPPITPYVDEVPPSDVAPPTPTPNPNADSRRIARDAPPADPNDPRNITNRPVGGETTVNDINLNPAPPTAPVTAEDSYAEDYRQQFGGATEDAMRAAEAYRQQHGGSLIDAFRALMSQAPTAPPATDPPVEPPVDPPPVTTDPDAPPEEPVEPSAVDSILPTLLAGVDGEGPAGELQTATNQAIRNRLTNPSPYNSDEVRAEYDWLAGNIDDDYEQQTRATDEAMAARGLYGSAGKDFHSGRLGDLNVGRRTARTSLARDLANRYATTAGQYESDAINQGLAGAGATNANQLDWLNTLFGYGQQGFENDMATAQFNENQNLNSQDLLMRMMAMGYGG